MSWASRGSFGLLLLATGCSQNILQSFADTSNPNYRIASAQEALDNYDFNGAISAITPVLATSPKNEQVAFIASAAYAGLAGMRILDLFTQLSTSLNNEGVLAALAQFYVGSSDASITNIETAMTILENYGALAANRSANMNFFALFLYYSRIGVNLNRYAYDPSTDLLLSNFKACHTSVNAAPAITGLPDAAVDRIMTSVPRILDTITGLAASVSGGAFDTLKVLPASVSVITSFTPIPCSSSETNPACLVVRNLIIPSKAEGGIGLGTGDTVVPCVTPAP